jgi:hypothetical protein
MDSLFLRTSNRYDERDLGRIETLFRTQLPELRWEAVLFVADDIPWHDVYDTYFVCGGVNLTLEHDTINDTYRWYRFSK